MRERKLNRKTHRGYTLIPLCVFQLFCFLYLCSPAPVLAQETEGSLWIPSGLFAQRVIDNPQAPEVLIHQGVKDILSDEKEYREPSPALAVALSAAVPGAGQLYAGRRRALVYFAVEVAALIAHFSYNSDGHRKEDQFKKFADAQWDTLRYREGSGIEGCSWSEESDSTIVNLEHNNRDRYYEQIAREEYVCGWRESWQRDKYRDLRDVSNSLFGKANTALTVIFLNHIISAADAFRITRSMRMSVASHTELRMDMEGDFQNPRAVIRLVRHL